MQPSGGSRDRDLAVLAREIIDANRYMTLAEELDGAERERGIATISRRSQADGID